MSDKYFFGHQFDDDNQITVELTLPNDTHYKDVSQHFFRFLSSVYGYEITAKDVVDADSSNT